MVTAHAFSLVGPPFPSSVFGFDGEKYRNLSLANRVPARRELAWRVIDYNEAFPIPRGMLPIGFYGWSFMLSEKKPYELIQDLVAERATWSDDDVIAEIEQLPPLADEGDPIWEDKAYWRVAYRFVGLSDVAAQRRLRPAVRLLLERACNGDPGEMMRGLRHASEYIFNPDWAALADVCMELAASQRTGTRLWAIDQLMILDDPRARQVFDNALHDDNEEIRSIAAVGLERLNGFVE
jgi:hypothetical protein